MPKPFALPNLRRSASFRRLIGLSAITFAQMLARLRGPWEIAQGNKQRSGRPWEVGGLQDHLLVMLLCCRCHVTQEFIGFFHAVGRSVIRRATKRIEPLAKPLFGVQRKPVISRKEAEALMADCTEQPIQRPGDDAAQRSHYAGKKKRHTLKTEYVVTARGRIASVSPSHPASRHPWPGHSPRRACAAGSRPRSCRQRLPGL